MVGLLKKMSVSRNLYYLLCRCQGPAWDWRRVLRKSCLRIVKQRTQSQTVGDKLMAYVLFKTACLAILKTSLDSSPLADQKPQPFIYLSIQSLPHALF